MADEKISAMTEKSVSQAFNPSFVANYFMTFNDENLTDNYKFNMAGFLHTITNVGSGEGIYKDTTTYTGFNLKSVVAGSSKLSVTGNTNDITLDVVPGNITITDLDGTLSLAKGGTGVALTDPGADRILFWDDSAGAMTWLTVGTGLSISTTTLSASFTSPLTTKGDILIYSSGPTRLPVGTNGQFLQANSAVDDGVEWVTASLSDVGKVQIDSGATAGYIGNTANDGVLRIDGTQIAYTDYGDYITLGITEENIDLDNCDNTTSRFGSMTATAATYTGAGTDYRVAMEVNGTTYYFGATSSFS